MRFSVVRALAGRQWSSSLRSGVPIWSALFALAIWVVARGDAESAADGVFVCFFASSIAALLMLGGAVARDREQGSLLLDRLHGAHPEEIAAANFASGLVPLTTVFVLFVAATFLPDPAGLDARLGLLLLLVAVGLLAWGGLIIVLGALLPGHGNSAAGFALLFFSALSSDAEAIAVVPIRVGIEGLTKVLPLPVHVADLVKAAIAGDAVPLTPAVVLAVWVPLAFALASRAIAASEPAAGWRR